MIHLNLYFDNLGISGMLDISEKKNLLTWESNLEKLDEINKKELNEVADDKKELYFY